MKQQANLNSKRKALCLSNFFLAAALVPSVALSAPPAPQETGFSFIGPEPFESCMDENYYASNFTAEQAYSYGQCFMALLEEFKKDKIRVELEPDKIYSLMQYADSWFHAAANLGSEAAKRSLFDNRMALNFYQARPAPGLSDESMQQVVSTEFQSLDEDKDGLLDLKEVVKHKGLYASFTSKDLDGDGRVSEQEFIIFYGEATAAGGR